MELRVASSGIGVTSSGPREALGAIRAAFKRAARNFACAIKHTSTQLQRQTPTYFRGQEYTKALHTCRWFFFFFMVVRAAVAVKRPARVIAVRSGVRPTASDVAPKSIPTFDAAILQQQEGSLSNAGSITPVPDLMPVKSLGPCGIINQCGRAVCVIMPVPAVMPVYVNLAHTGNIEGLPLCSATRIRNGEIANGWTRLLLSHSQGGGFV